MKNLQQYADAYVEKQKEYEIKQAKLKKTIIRANNNLRKLHCPSWIDKIIDPIAKAMVGNLPGRHYKILGPFGLGSTVAIHFYDNDYPGEVKNCLSISFQPGDLEKGELKVVDYSKPSNKYPQGSIGELNGFNYPEIDIEWNTEWLFNFTK